MSRCFPWHGCLLAATAFAVPALAQIASPESLSSRTLDVDYRVNEDALPLDAVVLWYTSDQGRHWVRYGSDEDRQPPMVFRAPSDGTFGLYVVITNATGSSSGSPAQGTAPQLWVHVDENPPVVQLHELRQTVILGARVLQVRWSAIDANFGARPVEIQYRVRPEDSWQRAVPDSLANTGRFDWRLPDALAAPFYVRVAARDRGGHQAFSEARPVERDNLPAIVPVHAASMERSAMRPAASSTSVPRRRVGGSPAFLGSSRAKDRARQLYQDAIRLGERGAYREGIAQLRRSVELNPDSAESFAAMADMLYRVNALDRSLDAYELALRQAPTMRKALRGAALVYRKKNDNAAAAQMLRTALRYNPADAEIWMNLGDIAIYQGDEVLARECYTRASQAQPGETKLIADAQQRLSLMTQVSRTYTPTGR